MVPREGFEPTRPKGHCALNAARLPFRHLGRVWCAIQKIADYGVEWWAMEDLNLRPPRCERGALTTELTAPARLSGKYYSRRRAGGPAQLGEREWGRAGLSGGRVWIVLAHIGRLCKARCNLPVVCSHNTSCANQYGGVTEWRRSDRTGAIGVWVDRRVVIR